MKIKKANNSIWVAVATTSMAIMFFIQGFEKFHYLIGFLFLIVSIITFSYKSGIEISKTYQIRNYISICGYSFGTWKNLPEIEYVSVVRVNQNRWVATGGFLGQEQSNNKVYNVKLILKNRKHNFINLISTSKDKALFCATEIGDLIDKNVLDYTEPNSKWLRQKETIVFNT